MFDIGTGCRQFATLMALYWRANAFRSPEVVPVIMPPPADLPGAPPVEPPMAPGQENPAAAAAARRAAVPLALSAWLMTGFGLGFGTGFWARCSESVDRAASASASVTAVSDSPVSMVAVATWATALASDANIGPEGVSAKAAVELMSEGPLPPTKGSTRVITAVKSATSSAERFICFPPSHARLYPECTRCYRIGTPIAYIKQYRDFAGSLTPVLGVICVFRRSLSGGQTDRFVPRFTICTRF